MHENRDLYWIVDQSECKCTIDIQFGQNGNENKYPHFETNP